MDNVDEEVTDEVVVKGKKVCTEKEAGQGCPVKALLVMMEVMCPLMMNYSCLIQMERAKTGSDSDLLDPKICTILSSRLECCLSQWRYLEGQSQNTI